MLHAHTLPLLFIQRHSIWFNSSRSTDREKLCSLCPPHPPQPLRLCSYVMTLIIVFFPYVPCMQYPESITHPFSLETWNANPYKATFHLGPLPPCTFLHQQHILLIFFFCFPRGITYFSIISHCTFRTGTSLKKKKKKAQRT